MIFAWRRNWRSGKVSSISLRELSKEITDSLYLLQQFINSFIYAHTMPSGIIIAMQKL